MSNVSTKTLRLDVLKKMCTSPCEEEGGDILDGQVKAVIGEELRYLDRVWEEDEVAVGEISSVREADIVAVTMDRIAAATSTDPELEAIREVIEVGSHQDMNTNTITRATVRAPLLLFISQLSCVTCYFRFFKTYHIWYH